MTSAQNAATRGFEHVCGDMTGAGSTTGALKIIGTTGAGGFEFKGGFDAAFLSQNYSAPSVLDAKATSGSQSRVLVIGASNTLLVDGFEVRGGYTAGGNDAQLTFPTTGARAHIVQYDHDGKYVKTVFPPPANLTEEQLKGFIFVELADGRKVLWGDGRAGHYGSYIPEVRVGSSKGFVVNNGRLAFAASGYASDAPLITLRTDGSSLDGVVVGDATSRFADEFDGAGFMAASPDGKRLYLSAMNPCRIPTGTGQRSGEWKGHAIWRIPWNYTGPLDKVPWLGEFKSPGPEADRFNDPNGIACDAAGNIYIADTGNSRIQVFSPEGKLIKTIRAERPYMIGVHQKTGEIYIYRVLPRDAEWKPFQTLLTKLGPLADPTVRATWRGETKSPSECIMALDSWSNPTRVWIVESGVPQNRTSIENGLSIPLDRVMGGLGGICVYDDAGDKFKASQNFLLEVAKDGFVPQVFGNGQMCQVVADPLRDKVYYFSKGCFGFGRIARFDPDSGKCDIVNMWGDDLAFGPDGMMYVRRVGHVARHDPETLKQFYFDYGVDGAGRRGAVVKGAVHLEDQPGPKTFQDGIGVGLDGTIAVLSNIWSVSESWGEDFEKRSWKYCGIREAVKAGWEPYQVRRFPGRISHATPTVWVFSLKGELIHEDHIPGLTMGSCGIQRDKDGNFYIGLNQHKVVNGKGFFEGSLVKFPPTGGRLLSSTLARNPPLRDIPDRAPDFVLGRAGMTVDPKSGQWAEGLLWSYGGHGDFSMPELGETCTCPNNRFDLDYFARAFIPECYRHSVGIVDTNGNLICHVGRYGNEDSRGPGSPVPVGGDEVSFAWPWYVAVTDRHLYVSDSANDRIVVVRLEYHRSAEAAVPAK